MPKSSAAPVLLISDTVWERRAAEILAIAPNTQPIIYVGDEPVADELLPTIDIAFFSSDVWPDRPRGLVISILKATHLKWMHTFSAGVDSPFFIDLIKKGVTLTNSSGAAASPIAQTAILYMLALSRNVRAWFEHQDNKEWERHEFTELDGARLAVIGMGPIGVEIARLGAALNMDVEGIRRTPKGNEPCPTFSFDHLSDVLGRADWVALALPLTPDTQNLFDQQQFAHMKPGAHFINVGRGELVDETALINALNSQHLAGAALDVFATEPLPEDSPLWSMKNVLITPHSSGASVKSGLRAEELFVRNFALFVQNEQMHNVVTI
jgi:phosphoglycerate dehydrogenase-like enzyme